MSDITVKADTAKNSTHRLFFNVSSQNISLGKTMTLSILNKEGVVLEKIGTFTFKKHDAGFYYLENSDHLKLSVMGNAIYFAHPIASDIYDTCYQISMEYNSSKDRTKKSLTQLITKN
jgi:hypothetical protein